MITMKNNNFMVGVTIFVVLIIVFSSLYYVFGNFREEEKKDEVEETITIDDQISPGGNQALYVEINRIRHRGLIDVIAKNGLGWRTPPSFYYACTRDGNTYISKDEAVKGSTNEKLYATWDTMCGDTRMQEDIEEEQETVEVSINIFERINSGILGLKSEDVEQEIIDLTYDFRTGRWTGDDFFKDDDGYGHYVGDTFEVWFSIYQSDVDGDKIPYWMEVNVLGTNPLIDDSTLDPDMDGIPTSWEWKWGYDPFSWDDHENLDPDIDGIQNIEEYQMSKYLANPFSQDIYIEVDGMEKGGFFDIEHTLYEETAQIMIERFTQHGINLYIDNGWPPKTSIGGGELLSHIELISQDSGAMLQFYRYNFADERKGIFRYMVVGHMAGFCIPSELNRYDTIVIDSSPYRVILRRHAFTPRASRIVLAAAALHELGHSLGIAPWTFQGNDNISFSYGWQERQQYRNTWGDYYSVMNYFHIWDKELIDYSDGSNGPPYDQNDWEHFYLPTFEIDSNAVEDPIIEPPGTDRLINESPEPLWNGWVIDENITIEYSNILRSMYCVKNVNNVDLRAYVSENINVDSESKHIAKIYAKPDTGATYSQWSLIAEGKVDQNGTVSFYSQKALIGEIYPLR